jgi:hypothetical protein
MITRAERPSDARRAQLVEAGGLDESGYQLVSNFFPLEKYYLAADVVSRGDLPIIE